MHTRPWLSAHAGALVWVPAPSQRKEGSGTLRITDLFFTPHGYRGATIECELVMLRLLRVVPDPSFLCEGAGTQTTGAQLFCICR